MGQIKNIKLHIVTDIKVDRLLLWPSNSLHKSQLDCAYIMVNMSVNSFTMSGRVLLLMFFATYVFCDTCRPIPFEDVQEASKAVYSISRYNLYSGKIVPGTTFPINKVIQANFLGQSLKAFVANREDVTLICFQGTRTLMQFLHQVKSAIIMDSITIGGRKKSDGVLLQSTTVTKTSWTSGE